MEESNICLRYAGLSAPFYTFFVGQSPRARDRSLALGHGVIQQPIGPRMPCSTLLNLQLAIVLRHQYNRRRQDSVINQRQRVLPGIFPISNVVSGGLLGPKRTVRDVRRHGTAPVQR